MRIAEFAGNLVVRLLVRLATVDRIAAIAARLVAKLLEWCRGKGDPTWERAKHIVSEINRFTALFMEIYEDDTLTGAEEKLIADAIVAGDNGKRISDILGRLKDQK